MSRRGTPGGVTFGVDSIWAAVTDTSTSTHSVVRYAEGSLQQTQQVTLTDRPVAIAGAKLSGISLPCSGVPPVNPFYVVVATTNNGGVSGGTGALRAYPTGNLSGNPVIHTFDGNPVAMVVEQMTGVEYAFVATTAPNQVLQFDVGNASANGLLPVATVSLGSLVPVRLVFDGSPGNVPSPACSGPEDVLMSSVGLMHVLVKNP